MAQSKNWFQKLAVIVKASKAAGPAALKRLLGKS
jgi:hypothetical protein